ncbi:hypothetical protein J4208_03070 [Candidatus Woesearchaeota archaeon]|nr:hypothetical protein [Candidatus Woesearchaeota archaeon]
MAVQSTVDRKKRKKWYTVLATKDLQDLYLGETLAEEPGELLGRHLHLNLMTLLNDPKKQSITVHFAIKELRGDIGIASLVHYQLNNSYLKRLVRKTSNKMEESYAMTTKDGQLCRIKPVLFTRHKVNNSTLTSLRKKAEEHLKQIFTQYTLSELFQFIISNKLQMELKAALKKIYPISSCEVKAFYTEQHSGVQQPIPVAPVVQPQTI